ncbi:TetR/AcrR family transcriptional regulator [Streptomyces koyangensis]|uniref:TetR/AcrR family transcriptional regulator n=1 Tax=Streptomyces koyangensis TaxID=188770 RepID=A0ABX7EF10_9ACTN|nr:TetR family transcriptional regulator [Streptomyces koyangensis]QRF02570.1 TetR/AcrR family transcriptional regulator [Streptomyces koyangensis]
MAGKKTSEEHDGASARGAAAPSARASASATSASAATPTSVSAPASAPAAPAKEPDGRTAKSEQTRTLILETALRLFQERGFDKTTMRAIAREAGVSTGNTYYYFASKEHLVQGFYDRIAEEHRAAVAPVLASETGLEERFAGVLTAWLDIAAPYHEFAAQFFKNAADPASPLSPFSTDSSPARDAAIAIQREVLTGSRAKPPAELATLLPELMWLAQMGLVLYWVFDSSPDTERTRRLAVRGARLTARGVSLSRFRVLRPLVREVHELLMDFLPGASETLSAKERRKGGGETRATASEKPAARERPAAD